MSDTSCDGCGHAYHGTGGCLVNHVGKPYGCNCSGHVFSAREFQAADDAIDRAERRVREIVRGEMRIDPSLYDTNVKLSADLADANRDLRVRTEVVGELQARITKFVQDLTAANEWKSAVVGKLNPLWPECTPHKFWGKDLGDVKVVTELVDNIRSTLRAANERIKELEAMRVCPKPDCVHVTKELFDHLGVTEHVHNRALEAAATMIEAEMAHPLGYSLYDTVADIRGMKKNP